MIWKSIVSIFFALLIISCGSDNNEDPEPITCDNSLVVKVITTTSTSTCIASDGEIVVEGQNGVMPYSYSIDNQLTFQPETTFKNLSPGNYTIVIRDDLGCIAQAEGVITSTDTDLNATIQSVADTECFTNNGTLIITASGGVAPYTFQVFNDFVITNTFNDLPPATYQVTIKDNVDCTITVSKVVEKGDSGTSYASDIAPIIMNSCAITGCHNGSNGTNRDYTDFSKLQAQAQSVKARTQNGSMPQNGTISDLEIALIACWVDEGAKDN